MLCCRSNHRRHREASNVQTFELAQLLQNHEDAGRAYHEFLRVPELNAGIYKLAAGATDLQQPHAQDEVYYVISGNATFSCDGYADRPVTAGSVIYVEKGVGHRFESITEDLTILVMFA